jgi:hypothetical protein
MAEGIVVEAQACIEIWNRDGHRIDLLQQGRH